MGNKTDKMQEILQNIKADQLDKCLEENWDDMLNEERAFTKFMRDIVTEKGLRWTDVYRAAGISENYGQEIIGMRKHVKNRDVIIRICLAARFNFEDTQHALKLYQMNQLYARDPRDAVLIVAISNRIYELSDIDILLQDQGMDIISTEIK